MIKLHRAPTGDQVFLNPDLFRECAAGVASTTIRLSDGTSYVVIETPDEVLRLTAASRALVRALAARLADDEAFDAAWYLDEIVVATKKADD